LAATWNKQETSLYIDGQRVAEDSGIEIEHLNGAPGVYSSRFAGPDATDEENLQKVLRLLDGIPPEKRNARFVSCMVLSYKGKIIKVIQEHVAGLIALQKKGTSGFGYDPIFYYPPLGRTFAELSAGQKNAVSHRGRALDKMHTFLLSYLTMKTPRRKERG
jgi:XTP/dITP diphosphohydrolase